MESAFFSFLVCLPSYLVRYVQCNPDPNAYCLDVTAGTPFSYKLM